MLIVIVLYLFAKISENKLSLKCDNFDHDGNKLFSKKMSDSKENNLKIADTLSEIILNDLGQEKINKLDELNDFDYTPKA